MDETMQRAGSSSDGATGIFGSVPVEAQDDGGTMRHGVIHRAMRHARLREMMQHMTHRHEMHRRMMHRATRHRTDD